MCTGGRSGVPYLQSTALEIRTIVRGEKDKGKRGEEDLTGLRGSDILRIPSTSTLLIEF